MEGLAFAVERFNCGVIADVGIRSSMEDTYIVLNDLGIEDYLKFSLYAVIDGHGGDWCANYLRKNLAAEIKKQLNDPMLGFRKHNEGNINECISKAFSRAFAVMDEAYYRDCKDVAVKCGATACVVLIVGNRIFTANVGDSRAVLCRSGSALNLTFDHKTVSH
jgi:protein phosphatase 2C family protein 2/3